MIGITERGDPAINLQWMPWVLDFKPAILISKNPLKLFYLLKTMINEAPEVYHFTPNVIVHTTITGFGGSIVEPNVPIVEESLKGFKSLCELLGPERVVLRIDPIIPTDVGINTAYGVLLQARQIFKTRVRISFIDQYEHVKKRFEEKDIKLPWSTFHAPLELRKKAWEKLDKPEICGEPDFECTGCISAIDCEILNERPIDKSFKQRPCCACLGNKKELLENKQRCAHACLYCYWKSTE